MKSASFWFMSLGKKFVKGIKDGFILTPIFDILFFVWRNYIK
jgi:hypothetical protein